MNKKIVSPEMVKKIEEIINKGNVCEIKVEKHEPVLIEIRRRKIEIELTKE